MKWLTVLIAALALATSSSGQQVQDRLFDPVGVWRGYHKDGTSFDVRLTPDGTARSTADGGQKGVWRWEGKSVRIVFSDGWDDVLDVGEDGQFIKRSWGPGTDRRQPSKNVSRMELRSRDLGGGD